MNLLWFNGWAVPRAWFETKLDQVFKRIQASEAVNWALAPAEPDQRQMWVQSARQGSAPRWWCGWSMGGLHALEAAERDIDCKGVIIVAGSPCFVRQPAFSFGLDPEAINDLQVRWRQSPEKTLKRFFQMILTGDRDARQHARALQASIGNYSAHDLDQFGRDLAWLARADFREKIRHFNKPIYFVLGENDPLLPCSESSALQALTALNPRVKTLVLEGVGHVPFLMAETLTADTEQNTNSITEVLKNIVTQPALSTNMRVVRGFDAAALQYQQVSGAQRAAARSLIRQTPCAAQDARRILDLGCGTGFVGRTWLASYGEKTEHVLGIDAAPNMIAQAQHLADDVRLHYRSGVLEHPVRGVAGSASWDVVLSSFALHWVDSPIKALQAWQTSLRPGGWLGLALPVDGSLQALAQSWAAVDCYAHTVNFPEWPRFLDDVLTLLRADHFYAWQQCFYTEHDSLLAMKKALKTLGAAGLQSRRRQGLMTPRQLQHVEEKLRVHASSRLRLPLAYHVGFLWVQKPK